MLELQELLRTLNDRHIRYLLCGGLAVNIYGVSRSTADIDILLDLTEENVAGFTNAVLVLKYIHSLPLRLEELVDASARQKNISERNLIAYSFYSSVGGRMSLDVLIDVPIPFNDMWERRETRSYEDVPVQLIHIQDLIALKNYAGREQDKQDVLLLSKNIQNGS